MTGRSLKTRPHLQSVCVRRRVTCVFWMILYSYGLPKSHPLILSNLPTLLPEMSIRVLGGHRHQFPVVWQTSVVIHSKSSKEAKKIINPKNITGPRLPIRESFRIILLIAKYPEKSNIEVKKVRYENFSGIDIADPICIQLHLNSLMKKAHDQLLFF